MKRRPVRFDEIKFGADLSEVDSALAKMGEAIKAIRMALRSRHLSAKPVDANGKATNLFPAIRPKKLKARM